MKCVKYYIFCLGLVSSLCGFADSFRLQKVVSMNHEHRLNDLHQYMTIQGWANSVAVSYTFQINTASDLKCLDVMRDFMWHDPVFRQVMPSGSNLNELFVIFDHVPNSTDLYNVGTCESARK
jgi:hypothetical protein